ncbi:MAG TPA: hypothetical protein VEW94_09660 [Chloroflexia bacterium]|nr:hypothetical protein [Chloroflexia bacterium]
MDFKWRTSLIGFVLTWALLGLGIIVGVGGAGGAAPALAQSSPVYGCEVAYDTPSTGNVETELNDIAAVSDNDVWGVGFFVAPNPTTPYSVHWDGQRWSQVSVPSMPGTQSELRGVAAISKNDVWAVGNYLTRDSTHPLAMHWNGTSWENTFVPEPNNLMSLSDVSGVAANDVWAVGSYYSDTSRTDQAFILHWDGTSWSLAQVPDFQPQSTRIKGVFARAADDVWAVGSTGPNPLFLHWNGTAWTIEPNAIVPVNTALTSVTAVSKNRAWAVGGSSEGPIIMHWDGDDWRQVGTPPTKTFPSSLFNVTAVSENDVWAVGAEIQIVRHADVRKLIVMHWDGTQWSLVPTNVSGSASTGQGVTSTREGSVWVAGSHFNPDNNVREPLLLRLNKTPCPPPAATPVVTPAVPLEPPAPLPGSGSVTFPETGKTIRGIFLDYWQRNGNLAQQGYPISNVMGEISDLDGRIYTVQYFERAVFEYHPENQAPFNVLLSQLGTFQYKKKYPNGAPNQRANPDAGTRFFPETGKHLGGAFHYYWVNHGGLPQQGYPITEEFPEISPLDGKLYTVQYFERAVFEYHPENQPPFEVLLSQLGRFRYDSKYGVVVRP